jgi:hypothetical protein
MSTDPVLDIYVEWDRYGWIVKGLDKPRHCSGPRTAAEDAAKRIFGQAYKLIFVRKGYYQAMAKE